MYSGVQSFKKVHFKGATLFKFKAEISGLKKFGMKRPRRVQGVRRVFFFVFKRR